MEEDPNLFTSELIITILVLELKNNVIEKGRAFHSLVNCLREITKESTILNYLKIFEKIL